MSTLHRSLCCALFLATGCQSDPVRADAVAWHAGLSSLMAENTSLAFEFQDLAVKVKTKNSKVKAEDIADLLGGPLVQTAEELAGRVPASRPETPEFQALHDELGDIWTERAQTYGKVVAAWKKQDREAILKIGEKNLENKLAEDWFLVRTNEALEPHRLRIELYPVSPAQ